MLLLSILYRLVRCLLGLTAVLMRRDLSKDAELLVLRHENAVLRLWVPDSSSRAVTCGLARWGLGRRFCVICAKIFWCNSACGVSRGARALGADCCSHGRDKGAKQLPGDVTQ